MQRYSSFFFHEGLRKSLPRFFKTVIHTTNRKLTIGDLLIKADQRRSLRFVLKYGFSKEPKGATLLHVLCDELMKAEP